IQEVTAARDAGWAAGGPCRRVCGYAWFAATYAGDAAKGALSDPKGVPSRVLAMNCESPNMFSMLQPRKFNSTFDTATDRIHFGRSATPPIIRFANPDPTKGR